MSIINTFDNNTKKIVQPTDMIDKIENFFQRLSYSNFQRKIFWSFKRKIWNEDFRVI